MEALWIRWNYLATESKTYANQVKVHCKTFGGLRSPKLKAYDGIIDGWMSVAQYLVSAKKATITEDEYCVIAVLILMSFSGCVCSFQVTSHFSQ